MRTHTGVFNAVHAILICIVQNAGCNKKRVDRFARGASLYGTPSIFMPLQSEIIASSAVVFIQSPTVIDQYLPLALVAQQMARSMG